MFMVLNQTKPQLAYKGLKNLASSKTYRHVYRIKKNSQLTSFEFCVLPTAYYIQGNKKRNNHFIIVFLNESMNALVHKGHLQNMYNKIDNILLQSGVLISKRFLTQLISKQMNKVNVSSKNNLSFKSSF